MSIHAKNVTTVRETLDGWVDDHDERDAAHAALDAIMATVEQAAELETKLALHPYESEIELAARIAELEAALTDIRRFCAEGHGDDLIAVTADAALAADKETP